MKKYNPTLVAISWVVTIIFALLFLINLVRVSNIQTPYGSPASSFPYVLGMLFGSGLIPGILWLITYLTASKDNTNPNNQGGSYGGGYDGGHNNSGSTNKSDEYNNGDLYN